MPLYRYEPSDKFTRIYIAAPVGCDPRLMDQDLIWEAIKTQHFPIDTGEERLYWDDDEDEQTERAAWFASWDDDRRWDVAEVSPIFVDSHY